MGRLKDWWSGGWSDLAEDRSMRPIQQPVLTADIPLTSAPVLDASQYNALAISDAYACVRALADSVASLPVRAYRDTPTGRTPAGPDSRVQRLINRPWPGATASDLFSAVMVHLNVAGNCYLGKMRDANGDIVQLWPLDPLSVMPYLYGDTLVYKVWLPNQDTTDFGEADILHLRAMGGMVDGLRGLSPVTQARLALTVSANLQESARQYFANGSRPSGILKVGGVQSDYTIEQLRQQWDARHRGTENMHRTAVVSGDVDFIATGFSADDSQFLQQRELSAREVARIFRLPAWVIDAEAQTHRTYANVTQQNLFFVQHSLRPWLTRIERAFTNDADLCMGQLYLSFDLDGLLRGDPDLRTTIYQRALGSSTQPGWMTVDEVRELENLEPMAAEQAETAATEAAEQTGIGDPPTVTVNNNGHVPEALV